MSWGRNASIHGVSRKPQDKSLLNPRGDALAVDGDMKAKAIP
jgi:hypothetical protein